MDMIALPDRRPARRHERRGGPAPARRGGAAERPSRADDARRARAARWSWRNERRLGASGRELYRTSDAHREGPDLDLLVEWAEPGPGVTALDVATGGGHVARRLREAGVHGRHVRSRARDAARRDLPRRGPARSPTRASTSSSAASPRTTSTTSGRRCRRWRASPASACSSSTTRSWARTSRRPRSSATRSHVRNYNEAEWRALFEARRPRGRGGRVLRQADRARSPGSTATAAWARTPSARRRCSPTGSRTGWIAARPDRAEGSASASGDHRRQRDAARRPGPDRLGGPLPRRRATATTARRSSPASRPGKGGQDVEGIPVFDTVAEAVAETGANTSMIFVPARFAADAIYEAVDAGIETVICIAEGLPAHEMLRVYTYIRPQGDHDDRPELPRRALARARRTSGSSRPRSSARAPSGSSRARAR